MMARQQLPPQIKKISLADGSLRYQVTADAGVDAVTGKRRQSRKRYRTEKEARTALAEIGTAVAKGSYVARSALTVAEAIEHYLAGRHKLRPTTLAGYSAVVKPVVARYGTLPVQQLSKRHLDDLIVELRAGGLAKARGQLSRPWQPRTVNLMLTVMSMVLDSEVQQGHVARNVAQLVDRLPLPRKTLETFTAAEVRTLLAKAAADRNGHAWHLALSGLRRGEICGVRWADVDFASQTIAIGNNRVLADAQVVENAPKTAASVRVLPLTAELLSALKSARLSQRAERLALGDAYGAGDHVVCDEGGAPYRPDVLSARWDRIVKDAGVKRIRLHGARHTCATLMHIQGVPIAVIAAWLGHADASFTMRTYAHSQNDALRDAASSLAAVVTIRDKSGA